MKETGPDQPGLATAEIQLPHNWDSGDPDHRPVGEITTNNGEQRYQEIHARLRS